MHSASAPKSASAQSRTRAMMTPGRPGREESSFSPSPAPLPRAFIREPSVRSRRAKITSLWITRASRAQASRRRLVRRDKKKRKNRSRGARDRGAFVGSSSSGRFPSVYRKRFAADLRRIIWCDLRSRACGLSGEFLFSTSEVREGTRCSLWYGSLTVRQCEDLF